MLTNYLIVGGLSFVVGFGSAWTVQDWRHDSKVLKANQKIEELTVIKDQFADIATPASVKSKTNDLSAK